MITPKIKRKLALKLKNKLCLKKGQETFRFQGLSMYPLLIDGDQVLVKYIKSDQLAFGDIIVYKTADKFIIHRYFYSKNETEIIAKGDNSFKTDPPFNNKYLVGKVIKIDGKDKIIDIETFSSQLILKLTAALSLMESVGLKIIKRLFFANKSINPSFRTKFIAVKSIILRKIIGFV
ncbi:S24/S26 family peptidase [Candidatus Margulisiibacteriota bacterium]